MDIHDPVNHPKHYTGHPSGVECITVTEHMNFCLGNAMKYIWRAGEKGNAIEDLRKAQWYICREINRLIKEDEKKYNLDASEMTDHIVAMEDIEKAREMERDEFQRAAEWALAQAHAYRDEAPSKGVEYAADLARATAKILPNDLAHPQKGRERGPDNTQD